MFDGHAAVATVLWYSRSSQARWQPSQPEALWSSKLSTILFTHSASVALRMLQGLFASLKVNLSMSRREESSWA